MREAAAAADTNNCPHNSEPNPTEKPTTQPWDAPGFHTSCWTLFHGHDGHLNACCRLLEPTEFLVRLSALLWMARDSLRDNNLRLSLRLSHLLALLSIKAMGRVRSDRDKRRASERANGDHLAVDMRKVYLSDSLTS